MQQLPRDGLNWVRFVRGVNKFVTSEVGGQAKKLSVALIALLLSINGLNIIISYVGRDFMTAIANRDTTGFVWQSVIYIAVFTVSTVVAVIYRFNEESLGLLWRSWLSRRLVERYVESPVYYRLDTSREVANPDERIADDVRTFTVTTLSIVLMILNGSFTVIAFAGVLWSISPLLFVVAVLYAGFGSFLTIALGRPLVKLNYDQFDKEANFRADLIQVRENAESIVMSQCEHRPKSRLLHRLDELVGNFQGIIAVNRKLGFFTTGYNYMIQIIPALVVAPLFIRGDVEFGVITQSAMAFAQLLGAFSLIVNQFQSLSSFAAVVSRLGSLMEAIDRARSTPMSAIEIRERDNGIIYDRLTLRSPRDGRTVVKDLSLSVPLGTKVLVKGSSGTAKIALFRATAGIWPAGEGRIMRPGPMGMSFLPERPYLYPGTLRQLLSRSAQEQNIPEERMRSILHAVGLDQVLVRVGGMDVEKDWNDVLSLSEQQLLAFSGILLANPCFVFFDRPDTVLGPTQIGKLLKMLRENAVSYLVLGDGDDNIEEFDAILELTGDGGWQWKRVNTGRIPG